jgi:hypothetical protein
MGGFRSQPLTVKDTVMKELPGLTYAVSSMCGIFLPTQVGDSTWRMRISAPPSLIKSPICSQFSTGMEVTICL